MQSLGNGLHYSLKKWTTILEERFFFLLNLRFYQTLAAIPLGMHKRSDFSTAFANSLCMILKSKTYIMMYNLTVV